MVYLLKTKVCSAKVYDAGKESKWESIDFHEKSIARKVLKKQGKELKRSAVTGEVGTLSQY